MAEPNPLQGVVASLDELVAARPHGTGGFSAGSKVRAHQYGGHRSAYRGRGMEFDEVRAYHPGDDIRTIDWRVTARTGRTHTKLFQEERERPVLILVDARASMRFGTRACFKSVLAARAAALLAWVGIGGGDRVGGLVLAPSGIASFRPERSRRRALSFVKRVAEATAEPAGGAEPSLAEALQRLRALVRPGTLVFLISDFADFDAPAVHEAERLAHQGDVSCLFVFDRLEAAMPGAGNYPVTDANGEGRARLEVERAPSRAAYAAWFAQRRDRVESLARERGMAFLPLDTAEDPREILHPGRLKARPPAARSVA